MSLDSRGTEISASLRKGTLYVKMPREKAVSLILALDAEQKDLISKEILESEKAFVFSGPTDDWNEDLTTLKNMGTTIVSASVVEEFILAVEAGLRNEAQVDWISRVKGPRREEGDTLESLFGCVTLIP